VETYAAIEDRVRPVWDKVISLIGYFDLDPNRALDIILDVLSQHLATHYTFFLTLLSFSPWTGSYLRPFRDEEVMNTKEEIPQGSFNKKSLDEILALVETNSLSGRPSNVVKSGDARVLAQVLGFKFKYYQVRYHIVFELGRLLIHHSRRMLQSLRPKTSISPLLY
jgi:THO complex subunit 2